VVGLASQSPEVAPTPVPKTNRSPVRSLRPTSVFLAVGPREVEVPPYPAVDWLEILMQPNWTADDIFIELLPNGMELILDGSLGPLVTQDLALDLIEEVSARHWWIALRLIEVVSVHWDVIGPDAIFNGVDAEKLSLAAWLDAMLVLLMRRISNEQQPMFVAQLEMPPAGEEIPEEEMEMSASQFLSMAD
jgi:hypothetical protein